MHHYRSMLMALAAVVLAACNLSVPQVTPTVAPSLTPSQTPVITVTPSATASTTPSHTPDTTLIAQLMATNTPTVTASPTDSPTDTPTVTASPTDLPTDTPTVTATSTDAPTDTPTATASPTDSPTDTPTATASPTDLPTDTPTVTASPTDLPTDTPTVTASPTDLPTDTPTVTASPTDSPTDTPTVTLTPTEPPSPTPLPTFGPTDTPTLTPTATATLIPSATPTRTLSPLEIVGLQNTQPPPPVLPTVPTITPVPPVLPTVPTSTPPPPATQDVPPTIITAAPDTPIPESPLTLPTLTPGPFPMATDTPAPVIEGPPATPTLAVALVPTLSFTVPEQRVFGLSTRDGLTGGAFGLLNDVTLFERNPVNLAQYAVTDSSGILYFTGVNGENASRVDVSPFSQFIPRSREENNAFVRDIAWSPDGQYLAFIVNGDQLANDGVWYFTPGAFPPLQLLVDCPNPGFPGCGIVTSPGGPDLWESLLLHWSPRSDALLVETFIPSEGRRGLTLLPATRDERIRDARPPIIRHDYGSWEATGDRLLVSGRAPDNNVYIAWLNRDGSFSDLVFDANSAGLWVQHAVQQPGTGAIFTLGAPYAEGGPDGAMRIYNQFGGTMTGPIGGGPPDRVEWSPDRSAVLVFSGGRVYLATTAGTVDDLTPVLEGINAINWVDGAVPAADAPAGTGGAIAPVGARPDESPAPAQTYRAGDRVRVLSTFNDQPAAGLNIRTQPDNAAPVLALALPGDFLIILPSPPVIAGALVWYEVRAEHDGIVGWVAGSIDGSATIGP